MSKLTGLDYANIVANLVERRRRKPVKVCLFGHVTRAAQNHVYRQFLEEQQEEAKRRWNFDFKLGQPLEGRYEWELVSRKLAAPTREDDVNCPLTPCKSSSLTDKHNTASGFSPKAVALDFGSKEDKSAARNCPTVSANDDENRIVTAPNTRPTLKRKRDAEITGKPVINCLLVN